MKKYKLKKNSYQLLVESCQLVKRGFTLIELLVVIAIIGILSSVVLVSTAGAVEKAKRVSALSSAASAMPVLVTCADEGGVAVAPAGGGNICNPATSVTGTWANLTSTGWSYGDNGNGHPATGTLAAGNYTFYLIKTGQTDITCTFADGSCS